MPEYLNRLLCYIILNFIATGIIAQPEYKPLKDVSLFREKAAKMTEATNTIESNFVQVKELSLLSEKIISKGYFYFKKQNLIRWEYYSPYEYLMVINGTKVMIQDEKKTMHYDMSSNKLFGELNDIMISCISGNIFSSDKFKIEYFEGAGDYKIELIPFAKTLRGTIKKFILYFDKNVTYVTRIELFENSDDVTQISFTDKKLNEIIDDEKFSVKQ